MYSKRSFLSIAPKFMVCFDRSSDKNELGSLTMVIDVNQTEMYAPVNIGSVLNFNFLYGVLSSIFYTFGD